MGLLDGLKSIFSGEEKPYFEKFLVTGTYTEMVFRPGNGITMGRKTIKKEFEQFGQVLSCMREAEFTGNVYGIRLGKPLHIATQDGNGLRYVTNWRPK